MKVSKLVCTMLVASLVSTLTISCSKDKSTPTANTSSSTTKVTTSASEQTTGTIINTETTDAKPSVSTTVTESKPVIETKVILPWEKMTTVSDIESALKQKHNIVFNVKNQKPVLYLFNDNSRPVKDVVDAVDGLLTLVKMLKSSKDSDNNGSADYYPDYYDVNFNASEADMINENKIELINTYIASKLAIIEKYTQDENKLILHAVVRNDEQFKTKVCEKNHTYRDEVSYFPVINQDSLTKLAKDLDRFSAVASKQYNLYTDYINQERVPLIANICSRKVVKNKMRLALLIRGDLARFNSSEITMEELTEKYDYAE